MGQIVLRVNHHHWRRINLIHAWTFTFRKKRVNGSVNFFRFLVQADTPEAFELLMRE
jgi:hypothetical protein